MKKKTIHYLADMIMDISYHLPPIISQGYARMLNHLAIYVADCIKDYLRDERVLNSEVSKAIDKCIAQWLREPESISDIMACNAGYPDSEFNGKYED